MSSTYIDIIIAVLFVATAIFLAAWFLRYKANNSERRMRTMLSRCGLDPEIIELGDVVAIMREVRRRCQKCQSEAVCERWLNGEEAGENSFCPNARAFEIMAKSS